MRLLTVSYVLNKSIDKLIDEDEVFVIIPDSDKEDMENIVEVDDDTSVS